MAAQPVVPSTPPESFITPYGRINLTAPRAFFAGRDFASPFSDDLFAQRRSGTCWASGNPYDPESLLTGAEAAAGMTYDNSRRNWGYTVADRDSAEGLYRDAVNGLVTTAEVAEIAPRVRISYTRTGRVVMALHP